MNEENIIDILKTVYDPEVPILDVYSMWLIYKISIIKNKINILMTLTSPDCPMVDMIIEMIKNSITEKYINSKVDIKITFDPIWNIDMIKDEDIREIFST